MFHARAARPALADDLDFIGRGPWGHPFVDDDLELASWPDLIDQTRLGAWALSPFAHEDAEPDDEDHGIEDLPHDARDEDGL